MYSSPGSLGQGTVRISARPCETFTIASMVLIPKFCTGVGWQREESWLVGTSVAQETYTALRSVDLRWASSTLFIIIELKLIDRTTLFLVQVIGIRGLDAV